MAIQLQEFAKQVLFGTTMEEKLSFPREEIIDTIPGNAIKTPRILTRPPHLKLREDGVKATHPSIAKLIDEKERGKLLHFFGNHELLATELMALVLLKFPEAPASFRQGVLDTLKEEQIHTQMYMHRMKQCGIEFGELPLNDYFWKSVSSMEDPLDYVTRLSLTFEQANLDYSREYGKIFQVVGDPATANILDKIYNDEIDHVGFGLKWFRRWKAAGKTDWEAYRERLIFPLSPARAKGNIFNTEGRREIGLDETFIDSLQLFTQSRGRTPTVFWFNPDAETFADQNSDRGFDWGASKLQNDLEFLPAFLSKKGDILILQKSPSPEFLKQTQDNGFELPEIIVPSPEQLKNKAPEISRKIGDIRPWAWTPESLSFFEKTFAAATRPPKTTTLWNKEIQKLHSKTWSANLGKKLAREGDSDEWLAPAEVYGQAASTHEELQNLRKHFQNLGYANIACKAPFGTAANGNRCLLADEDMSPNLEDWLATLWQKQGTVIIEPWLNRVFDFSLQLNRQNSELKIIAYTRLLNNARGQFRGILTNAFCKGIDPEIARFLMTQVNGQARVYNWYEQTLVPYLNQSLQEFNYSGPLGIDAFVYRDPSGELKLKSVVELNPRITMGRIAHELGERTVPGTIGFFEILNRSQLKKNGEKSFFDYTKKLVEKNPITLKTTHSPRIAKGSFPLNDPAHAKNFMAMYHVREHINNLPI